LITYPPKNPLPQQKIQDPSLDEMIGLGLNARSLSIMDRFVGDLAKVMSNSMFQAVGREVRFGSDRMPLFNKSEQSKRCEFVWRCNWLHRQKKMANHQYDI